MHQILITGSNRGIGFAITRELLEADDVQIFAACRQPQHAPALQELVRRFPARVFPIELEVTDQQSIAAAIQEIQHHTDTLDVVVNNAGIDPDGQSLQSITPELMLHVLEVNAVAPLMVARACLPLLKRSEMPRIVMISSEMASLEMRTYGGSYGYCASKAALNMTVRGLAADLRDVVTVALDPGWVRTDMGGASATLAPEQSARGIVRVISGLSRSDSGRYLAWDGTEHPW
jgi:NAD(P)-dependent dehydrogenase (short-subunit alcohol dehydrogenase family)